MLPTRWSHLVRHGLVGGSLVAAATSNAAAEPCDTDDEAIVAVVVGLDFAPRTKLIGGIEARKCLSRTTEGFVRLEIGGARPRFIGGARVFPLGTDEMDFSDNPKLLGLEAGAALDFDGRFGVHLGASYGARVAYLAAQALFHITGPEQPTRMSAIVGLAPWSMDNPAIAEGRPLMVGGKLLCPQITELPDARCAEDRAVRDHFASSAQFEYSSVWTFLRLAAELHAVGAPAHLIAAALDAADDEVRHAELCAAAAGGVALAPLPLSAAQPRFTQRSPRALAMLAAEAWLEGCLNEGAAAAEARFAADLAEAPARTMLATIATDEARHAELAWATLAWLFEVAPDIAREALANLPPSVEAERAPADSALARRGVPSGEITAAAHADAHRTARRRLQFV